MLHEKEKYGLLIVCPLLQLQRRHRHAGRMGDAHRTDAIEELKSAFESAERSSPGVTDAFVRDLFSKLLPNMTEAKIRQAQDNLMRWKPGELIVREYSTKP